MRMRRGCSARFLPMKWNRHYYLKTSDALTDEDKAYFAKMLTGTDENIKRQHPETVTAFI